MTELSCHDCGRPYGDAHGFPDLVLPHDKWAAISPTGDENGLLCPSCICKRAHDAGIECEAVFRSGPFVGGDRGLERVPDHIWAKFLDTYDTEIDLRPRENSGAMYQALLEALSSSREGEDE